MAVLLLLLLLLLLLAPWAEGAAGAVRPHSPFSARTVAVSLALSWSASSVYWFTFCVRRLASTFCGGAPRRGKTGRSA